MISPLYDTPAPEAPQPITPDAQMLGVMMTAAIELARADQDEPMPLDTSFDVHVSFEERELEVIWPCDCGAEDCTTECSATYEFDELLELIRG
jgi:hypothetical protein